MIDALGKFVSSVSDALEINQATLSGCIDIIVTEQPDGTLMSSPFHVRFGKLKVLKTKEKEVIIHVNGQEVPFKMKLGSAGEAYFEEKASYLDDEPFFSDDQDAVFSSEGEEDQAERKEALMSPREKDNKKDEKDTKKEEIQKPSEAKKKWFFWGDKEDNKGKEKENKDKDKEKDKEKENKQKEEAEKKKEPAPGDKKRAKSADRIDTLPEFKNGDTSLNIEFTEDYKSEKKGIIDSFFGIFKGDKQKKDQKKDTPNSKDLKIQISPNDSKTSSLTPSPKNEDNKLKEEKKIESEKTNSPNKEEFAMRIEKTSPVISAQPQEKHEIDHFYDGMGDIDFSLDSPKSKSKEKEKEKEKNKQKEKENKDKEKEKPKETEKNKEKDKEKEPIKQKEAEKEPENLMSAAVGEAEAELDEEADIELSLCGDQITSHEEDLLPLFLKHKVSFEKFVQDPMAIINNPNLMVKIEDKLYDWRLACPLIVSLLAFKKPLPEDTMDRIVTKHMAKSSWRDWFSRGKKKEGIISTGNKKTNPPMSPPTQSKSPPTENKPIITENKPVTTETKSPTTESSSSAMPEKVLKPSPEPDVENNPHVAPKIEETQKSLNDLDDKIVEAGNYSIREEDVEKQEYRLTHAKGVSRIGSDAESVTSTGSIVKKKVRRTLRPTSDMLKAMNLKPGCNPVIYTVISRGEQKVYGFIYFWPSNAKVVISDVDGTITKSDVLGHVLPIVGKDWSHPGITSLYSAIVKNGYHILYLTARAIGQSAATRNYLTSLQQDGSVLPQGPILMSPDRLVYSFKREVIHKRPEVFKIAALREIRNLFPAEHNPFYAGFGNRETDAIAYRAVGIPLGKIFIINPQGEISQYNNTYKKSYGLLNNLVDEMFPPVDENEKYQAQEEFNSVNYFRINYENIVDITDLL